MNAISRFSAISILAAATALGTAAVYAGDDRTHDHGTAHHQGPSHDADHAADHAKDHGADHNTERDKAHADDHDKG